MNSNNKSVTDQITKYEMSVNHSSLSNKSLVPIGYFNHIAYNTTELKDDVKVLCFDGSSTTRKNHSNFIHLMIEDVFQNLKLINSFSGPISNFCMAFDEVSKNIFTISGSFDNDWRNDENEITEEKPVTTVPNSNSRRIASSFLEYEICDSPSSSKGNSYAYFKKIEKNPSRECVNRETSCERKVIKGKKEKETFWNCTPYQTNLKKYSNFTSNLKRSICSIFKSRKCGADKDKEFERTGKEDTVATVDTVSSISTVSLPTNPVNSGPTADTNIDINLRGEFWKTDTVEQVSSISTIDRASNFDMIRDCGWYWGPMSSDDAEELIQNEPNGSFLVRDSRDEHYIFSLTFILDGLVRHVRIDHNNGTYSFGDNSLFRSNNIVEFIENAVAHSQSGRYIFFYNRSPLGGPVRVQLLNPVSRFRQVNSLQHICRFSILKVVTRDMIPHLPLPPPLIAYLNHRSYFAEL